MYTKDDAKANKQVRSLCVYANGRAKNYFCFICTACWCCCCCCCCLFSICIHLLFLFRILVLLRAPIIEFVCLSHSISSCTQGKMPKNRNFSYMRSQHQHIHTYTSSNNTTISTVLHGSHWYTYVCAFSALTTFNQSGVFPTSSKISVFTWLKIVLIILSSICLNILFYWSSFRRELFCLPLLYLNIASIC